MNTIFTKLKDMVNFNDDPEEYEYYEDETDNYQEPYQKPTSPSVEEEANNRRNLEQSRMPETGATSTTRNNVIGMPGVSNGISEVVVFEPHSFEEMPQVIQTLRERRSVVLNLNVMDPEEAQRAVDFVAGGTFAIDGHQERIGESIFLFTPSCVKVRTVTGGISHEATETPQNPVRPSTPTPIWQTESTRMAQ